MSSSGISAVESAEKQKQIKLKGQIAREKTRQLTYDYQAEKINTQTSRLKIESSRFRLNTEQSKLQGQRIDLQIAQNDVQIKSLGLQQSTHKLGMAQDATKALGAERQLKQRQLAEHLNSLSLSVSESQEANRLKLNELKAMFNKVPGLQSTV